MSKSQNDFCSLYGELYAPAALQLAKQLKGLTSADVIGISQALMFTALMNIAMAQNTEPEELMERSEKVAEEIIEMIDIKKIVQYPEWLIMGAFGIIILSFLREIFEAVSDRTNRTMVMVQ